MPYYRVTGTYRYTMEYEESVDRVIRAPDEETAKLYVAEDEFGLTELDETDKGMNSSFDGVVEEVDGPEG